VKGLRFRVPKGYIQMRVRLKAQCFFFFFLQWVTLIGPSQKKIVMLLIFPN
jgi:hypothetical protein